MECPNCNFDNPTGFTFCGRCGSVLVVPSPKDRLTSNELDHLRTYLPPTYVEALKFNPTFPNPTLLKYCMAHLNELLQTIFTHLIANVSFDLGEWQKADQHYRDAHQIFDQLGDIYYCAVIDNNLGGIAKNQGRLDEALNYYQQGLRSLEKIGESVWVQGVFHMNLGATYVRRNELEPAYKHLKISQDYYAQAQARDFLPELHRLFAAARLRTGELEEAEKQCQTALSLARELGMKAEEGKTLRILGEVAAAGGHFDQAGEHLEQSIAILAELKEEYEWARSKLDLAKLYALQDKFEPALTALEKSMTIFQRLDAAQDMATARALKEELLGGSNSEN
jgi:tetratricopeptide (TPR) repeat protein